MAVIVYGQEKTRAIDKATPVKTDGSCLTTDTKPTDWADGSTITVMNATVTPKVVDSIWQRHDGDWYKF